MIRRQLDITLPRDQSAFLWGPRKTGKSTYLKETFKNSVVFDFLQTDLLLEFRGTPSKLRERLAALDDAVLQEPVILDEVQKLPNILDEVHWLIENRNTRFILCGSSARKLKRSHANMLGGRAWRFELFPLTYAELADFDLLRALNHGLVPQHYLQGDTACRRSLKAYREDYLKQEIFDEGLVRNMPAFTRFFDTLAFSHGEQVNFANIARDCAVDAKTVKEYYHILTDTLLGTLVEPFSRKRNRQIITKAPKFYLFDTGVAGSLTGRWLHLDKGAEFGRAFEHFIFMELAAYRSYRELEFPIRYWRTKSGVEVDFVLGDAECAIEIKGGKSPGSADLRGLKAFAGEHAPRRSLLVCNEQEKRKDGVVEIVPWRVFLDELWNGRIIR